MIVRVNNDTHSASMLILQPEETCDPPEVSLTCLLYSVLCCVLALHFVFFHPITSAKCPSVSPASDEKKKRKVITLELKLKIIAQL